MNMRRHKGGVKTLVLCVSVLLAQASISHGAGSARVNTASCGGCQVYLPVVALPLPIPQLNQPADGAQIISLAPLLSWTPQITGTYKIQVATSPAFPPAPTTEVSTTTTVQNLQPQIHVMDSYLKFGATIYYWRVGVVFQGSYLFSPIQSFTTPTSSVTPLPPSPVLTAPSDHAILPAPNAVLSWQSVPGALYYRVKIYSPGPTLFDSAILSATSYNVTGLNVGVSYTWKVKTLDQHGWGNYGKTRTFTAH
jgi:hypothetical protein